MTRIEGDVWDNRCQKYIHLKNQVVRFCVKCQNNELHNCEDEQECWGCSGGYKLENLVNIKK